MKKLSTDDVILIRRAGEHRRDLLRQARELSDAKLAEKFEVHHRTIEDVIAYRKRANG